MLMPYEYWTRKRVSARINRRRSRGKQLAQWHGGIGEAGGVHGLAAEPGTDQVLDIAGHVPDVRVHAGAHPPATDPERDELGRLAVHDGRISPEHDLVVAARLDV